MKIFKTVIYLCLLAGLSFSCISKKKYVLLQSNISPAPDSTLLKVEKNQYLVRPGDLLYISVLCPDQEAVAIFNMEGVKNSTSNNSNNIASAAYLNGYIVNDLGKIRMPIVGYIDVVGTPLDSIDARISRKLSIYLKDVVVKVRLYSFKVTVLGDVRNPGVQTIQAERYTILEAIGNANDLTDFASRTDLELLRATPEGYEVHKIDLTDQNLVKSPYFYMAPNDILYIKPLKAKMVRLNYPVAGYIVTGITSLLLLLNLYGKF